MEKALAEKIASLPTEPGVYVMKDCAGDVVYVGKAVNLRDRVGSYLGRGDQRAFVPLLDRILGDVETIVVKTEKEALLLENELVSRYKPRFNVKLRNGRNFIYLRLDPRQRYPRLEVTRQVRNDGARYFGPYPLARALRDTLRVVNRHFKLRTCSDHDARGHKRPCVLCQIARFPAPSVYDIPADEYRRHVEGAILFLQGKKTELIDHLRDRMDEAAAALRFEEAAAVRDQLAAIEQTLQPQKIVTNEPVDSDAFGYCREDDRACAYALYVRQGRVIGGQGFRLGVQKFPDQEVLASFIHLYYNRGNFIPDEVLIPFDIEGGEALAELLSERKGSKVKLVVPARGWRTELTEMSVSNAAEFFGKPKPGREQAPEILERLRSRLGLARVPHRMECFDVSHFHGRTIVASKVAMTDGLPDKDRYRRYKITTVQVGDDYAALYEVIGRRLRRGLEENDLPDLLVIDGGKGQLAAAQAAMKDLGVTEVDAIALAKERAIAEPTAPSMVRERIPERIFLPARKEPLVIPQDAPEMLLLMRLRDEAHRFAITFQRKLMRKARIASELETVPGIGEERRNALLRHFGSVVRIRGASTAELAEVEGIGPKLAQQIHAYLQAKSLEPDTGKHAPRVHPG
jgi:excinuclease ABC subunit C